MDEHETLAAEMLVRVKNLYAHLGRECSSVPDMGLLLCATLMHLVINIEGQVNDSHTLGQLTTMFAMARKAQRTP